MRLLPRLGEDAAMRIVESSVEVLGFGEARVLAVQRARVGVERADGQLVRRDADERAVQVVPALDGGVGVAAEVGAEEPEAREGGEAGAGDGGERVEEEVVEGYAEGDEEEGSDGGGEGG